MIVSLVFHSIPELLEDHEKKTGSLGGGMPLAYPSPLILSHLPR